LELTHVRLTADLLFVVEIYQEKTMLNSITRTLFCALILTLAAFTYGCSTTGGDTAANANGGAAKSGALKLQAGGATFPNPLYQKWISEYQKINPNIQIDYQSIGSGGGIKGMQDQTFDFGASDKPLSDEELKKMPREVVHIPTVLGAVVLTYNLPDLKEPLKFSPDVIADIYLGKIKRWDDARIKSDNPNAKLPAADIAVVYRSDGSGTSAVFTDYLSKVSSEWKEKVGSGTSPSFPIGQGGKGNEGVTGQVKSQPNTIGYVELIYAAQQKLPVALIKNASGKFVEPTLDAVTAAASDSLANTPDDLRVSITNAPGAGSYPISSYTYLLVFKDMPDAAKGKAIVDFLWWAIHDGERFAQPLQYAPLPAEIVKRAETKINSITSGGKSLRGA
jgi:phosphate transport system substrate-binding protein